MAQGYVVSPSEYPVIFALLTPGTDSVPFDGEGICSQQYSLADWIIGDDVRGHFDICTVPHVRGTR